MLRSQIVGVSPPPPHLELEYSDYLQVLSTNEFIPWLVKVAYEDFIKSESDQHYLLLRFSGQSIFWSMFYFKNMPRPVSYYRLLSFNCIDIHVHVPCIWKLLACSGTFGNKWHNFVSVLQLTRDQDYFSRQSSLCMLFIWHGLPSLMIQVSVLWLEKYCRIRHVNNIPTMQLWTQCEWHGFTDRVSLSMMQCWILLIMPYHLLSFGLSPLKI